MPRTAITSQKLDTKAGEVITFVAVDQTNGMQVTNTGKQVVLLNAPAAASVSLTVPSVACGHGRTGDASGSITASQVKAFGPFEDPLIWGDGTGLLYLNFASLTGSVTIAVVEI